MKAANSVFILLFSTFLIASAVASEDPKKLIPVDTYTEPDLEKDMIVTTKDKSPKKVDRRAKPEDRRIDFFINQLGRLSFCQVNISELTMEFLKLNPQMDLPSLKRAIDRSKMKFQLSQDSEDVKACEKNQIQDVKSDLESKIRGWKLQNQ